MIEKVAPSVNDIVVKLREGAEAWDAFVLARQRMNDARPDPVTATRAERDLYDERYRADNEAERTFRAAACAFFRDGFARAAIEAMPLNDLREERTMTEALRRAILAGDNLLAELEAHQESTGELLIEEDQAVVEGAKADLEYARAALESLK